MKRDKLLPTCEIITIGSELLLGQILDTNSAYLASELAKIGVDVRFRTSVGDNAAEMDSVIRNAISRCDIVITTGGLGPTEDDLTREVIAHVAGCALEFRGELMEQIEAVFRRYGYRMPETNRKQAYVPEGATIIENPVGTAPAFIKEIQGVPVICLPGVPKELRYLWEKSVAPWITKEFGLGESRVTYRVLKAAGIGESKVDMLIGDLIRNSGNPTIGLLASPGEIRIRITAEADSEKEARAIIGPVEKEIRARLGNKIFGADDDTLEGCINKLLLARGLGVAVLETFTGGKITERLLASRNTALRESVVIPRASDLSKRFGIQISIHRPEPEQVKALARTVASRHGNVVGLAVVGFTVDREGGCFVQGCAAAEGDEVEKIYSWEMGGDISTLRQRGTVIGLNTLRLGLLETS